MTVIAGLVACGVRTASIKSTRPLETYVLRFIALKRHRNPYRYIPKAIRRSSPSLVGSPLDARCGGGEELRTLSESHYTAEAVEHSTNKLSEIRIYSQRSIFGYNNSENGVND